MGEGGREKGREGGREEIGERERGKEEEKTVLVLLAA